MLYQIDNFLPTWTWPSSCFITGSSYYMTFFIAKFMKFCHSRSDGDVLSQRSVLSDRTEFCAARQNDDEELFGFRRGHDGRPCFSSNSLSKTSSNYCKITFIAHSIYLFHRFMDAEITGTVAITFEKSVTYICCFYSISWFRCPDFSYSAETILMWLECFSHCYWLMRPFSLKIFEQFHLLQATLDAMSRINCYWEVSCHTD